MPTIWENTPAYLLSKRYVVWAFREYFSSVTIVNEENLPAEGPVIFAPNHLNALMDALAVLALPPRRLPKVFLARADLFRLPKVVVRFIRFTKILPAYRIRDGYDQLDRNKETFEEAEQTLLNRSSVTVMPEGNQGEERNIRPLVKGIFRIAFSAQQKMPAGMSVKIIPIGLEYGDLIEYQRSLIIKIGTPIDVADYMEQYAENQVKATNELKNTLREALESLTVHLPAGSNYPLYDTLVEWLAPEMAGNAALPLPLRLFNARCAVAAKLRDLEKNEPDTIENIRRLHEKYKLLADRLKLPAGEASRPFVPGSGMLQIQLKIVLAWIGMLPGALINYLPYKLITSVPAMAGIRYSGFFSSVFYGSALIVLPLYYLAASSLLAATTPLAWWSLFVSIPLFYLSGKLSFRLYRCIRDLRRDRRMLKLQKKVGRSFDELIAIRLKIIALIR
jgi:1-acyl-sn-glycerol-3-phosphate acyltransferase